MTTEDEDIAEQLEQVREDLGSGKGTDPIEALLAVDERLDTLTEEVDVPLLNGEKATYVFRPLSGEKIEECQDRATRWVKRGRGARVQEMDAQRMSILMVVESCIAPDLNDRRLLQHYRAVNPEDLVARSLLPGTIDGLGSRIMELSGYNDDLVAAGKS